jgi:hypothetical protein
MYPAVCEVGTCSYSVLIVKFALEQGTMTSIAALARIDAPVWRRAVVGWRLGTKLDPGIGNSGFGEREFRRMKRGATWLIKIKRQR